MANSFQGEAGQPELASVSELAENLVYRLPGCTDIVVRKTIREVYREFCRETQCLTAERRLKLINRERIYPVSAMFGGVVCGVREVRLDNLILKVGRDYTVNDGCDVILGMQHVLDMRGGCRENGMCDGSFQVDRIHTGDAHWRHPELVIVAYEIPKLESEKAPRWFIEKHGEAIVQGVLSKLLSVTGRPWSDPAKSAEARIEYENMKSETRMMREYPSRGGCIDMSQVL